MRRKHRVVRYKLEILNAAKTITVLRLARYLGISGQFWMNLQMRYDLEMQKDNLGESLLDVKVLAHAKQENPEI